MRNEAQTRLDLIDPKLNESQWKGCYKVEAPITDGRLIGGGKRGKILAVDYLLQYKNENLAIIEAKKESLSPTSGLEQAKKYGKLLKLQIVYTTNGKQTYEFDMLTGKGRYIERYPTPEELYQHINAPKGNLRERIINQPYSSEDGRKPRYYQELAINKAIEAITKGQERILLTLATGTGKTFIAFQLVYKLYQARWNVDGADRRPKILFLADRNILADQAINTFNPLEKQLVKIDGSAIRKRGGKVPTNFNIYFAIYQAIAERENIDGYYKDYPQDFFDLIVIDECHRGGANEEGTWHKILEHFKGAVHLGLTATPKRKDNVDTYNYFGKPVYEYALKDGINDGFLSPYKVKRFKTTLDEYNYQNTDTIVEGEVDYNKTYSQKNFNRDIILYERIDLIARTIIDQIKPLDKTIVFCVDQEHAANMRDALNNHKTILDANYCVRVTSDDGQDGRKHLEHFQDNDKTMPTIITSSQMLTTGVDARNVRNIVLVRNVGSMVEFKQIIGRGTRLFEGKDYFTVLDFTDSSELFKDKEWDGLPEEETVTTITTTNPKPQTTAGGTQEEEPPYIGTPPTDEGEGIEGGEPKQKIRINLGKNRLIEISKIETQYIDQDGRPMNAEKFLQYLVGILPKLYQNEQQLRAIWSKPESRSNALKFLEDHNINEEHLEGLKQLINAQNSDVFDVLNYLSHSKAIHSRQERAVKVRDNEQFFNIYKNLKAQDFLKFILERYEQDGIRELDRNKLSELIRLHKLEIPEAVSIFGGNEALVNAFLKLQEELYKAS